MTKLEAELPDLGNFIRRAEGNVSASVGEVRRGKQGGTRPESPLEIPIMRHHLQPGFRRKVIFKKRKIQQTP